MNSLLSAWKWFRQAQPNAFGLVRMTARRWSLNGWGTDARKDGARVEVRFGVGEAVRAAGCGFWRTCLCAPSTAQDQRKSNPHLFIGFASMPNGYYIHLLFDFINGVNHAVIANADSPK
jgi:hypothetical protein